MSINYLTYAWLKKYVDQATAGSGGVSAGGEWSSEKFYQKGTIVSAGGKAYIAIQDVPVGTDIHVTSYWSLLIDNQGGSDKTFRFQQTEVSKEWWIPHNLDKYPSVVITDALGEVMAGDIQYIDSNNIKISLITAANGWANLN